MSYISDDFAPVSGIQELSFDEIDLVNGAINRGNVASGSLKGAAIGGLTGALAGSLVGGGGALPGALAFGLIGGITGSVGGAAVALWDELEKT